MTAQQWRRVRASQRDSRSGGGRRPPVAEQKHAVEGQSEPLDGVDRAELLAGVGVRSRQLDPRLPRSILERHAEHRLRRRVQRPSLGVGSGGTLGDASDVGPGRRTAPPVSSAITRTDPRCRRCSEAVVSAALGISLVAAGDSLRQPGPMDLSLSNLKRRSPGSPQREQPRPSPTR
jgi:hypothetical protein